MPSHQFTSFPELGPVVLLELRRLTTYVPLWFLNLVAAGIYSASFPIKRGRSGKLDPGPRRRNAYDVIVQCSGLRIKRVQGRGTEGFE